MKKMDVKKRLSVHSGLMLMLAWCAALGWWGALYPQFTLVDGTYEIVCESADTGKNSVDLYRQLLGTDPGQIRIKSRLLEDWKAYRKAGSEKNESGD